MDLKTREFLGKLGIRVETVPLGSMKLLDWEELQGLGERSVDCRNWIRNPNNRAAIGYSIDTEHKPCVGIVLRNLHSGVRKDHKTIAPDLKPLWHNFFGAIPEVYRLGMVVLVEGPKDARVLASAGIPVMACMAAIPSHEHFRVIHRYASTVIWIGDRDAPDERTEARLNKARWQTRELGLKFVEITIPAKDPAELANNPEWLKRIRDRVYELSIFTR